MAVDDDRLEGRHDVADELAGALLAIMREQRAQPLHVGLLDRDPAGPFLVIEEVLVAGRQIGLA